MYGLHQAPRAWYARLSTFLLKHNYRRGTIDKTLFIKKNSRDIILVQVYVDDIIFGSTNKAWCDEFEVLMKGEFEMSAMGELTFFLGLQVKQEPGGIFISQDKYVQDMLKKFDMESVRPATTPFEASKPKSKDEPDDAVNVHLYRSMIGLWYPRDSPFVLKAYSDSDYAGSHGDRKSTTGGCQFLGRRLISWQCKKQTIVATSSTEAEYVAAANYCGPKVHEASEMVESNSDYAEELARLQRQEHEAKDTAEKYGFGFSKDIEEHLRQADMVPAGSIDPAASIPAGSIDPTTSISAGSIDLAASISVGSAKPFPTVIEPVHADETSLPPGYSLGSSEHSIRFPSPSDLANSISSSLEMEDIYHHPSTGIFSSSSYDADFGGTVTNLAPIEEEDKRNIEEVQICVVQAFNDLDWVEAIQEEMQQFINQKVWKLVPLPDGKIAIRTKWILKNKRDAIGIVVRNKARLVAQGHRQEEGIASYMGFMVYQMDVKSAFLYGEIQEEVYVTQPKGFEDPHFPKHVYMDDIIFGSTNQTWCDEFEVLMKGEFKMSVMGELTFFLGLQVKQQPNGIFISQDKYVQDMLRRFDMESVRPATTPYEAAKPKSKDEPDDAVNVHLYRSMIGSIMYLTASRPDIMFVVSACSRHQVTPLTSNLNAKLGLWYPRDSPFVLEAYSDSDYAGSNGDRKSTTGGCQFLGRRLISWQCKKQTVVATSSTEAEYVAAAHCCGQSTICIVKNPVFHQRTKHIEIRHHFIRDANEKNLIQWYYWFLLAEQFLLVVFLVSAGRVVPAGLVNFSLGLTFL
ncbi:putative ribonuclease H-like domain-containing protein [Tanacetum coccineum]|uniref:Ribonuclease H-like domain-containing protein n=1 Tax=Tanacetum coccineum TaxID=301880 RepID=A0ABQ5EZB8_9ASTR